jgi:hypothetical protein
MTCYHDEKVAKVQARAAVVAYKTGAGAGPTASFVGIPEIMVVTRKINALTN